MVAGGGGVRGCLGGACMVAHMWGGVHGCCPGGACVVARGGGHAWDTTTHGDTVNERAVRILLECILVSDIKLTVEVISVSLHEVIVRRRKRVKIECNTKVLYKFTSISPNNSENKNAFQ